jgi:hypothetical protein
LDAESTAKADDIVKLGGTFLANTSIAGAQAYVYLKLPHNSVRASGKPLPFSSDLLVQPIVITSELFSASAVFIVQSGGSITTAPNSLAAAQLQVKQESLTDSSDLLARRVDMNSHAYTFPLMYFCQSETQIPCANGGNQTVNLTGFRGGEVKNIVVWLTLDSEQVPGNTTFFPCKWYPLTNVQLTYNGEIFSRFDAGSTQLWNLLNDEKSSKTNLNLAVPATSSSAPFVSTWVDMPFSQVNVPYDKEMKLVHGKPILNAVVNLQFTCPNSSAYTLHAMYLYNASLLCSRGSAEYIF